MKSNWNSFWSVEERMIDLMKWRELLPPLKSFTLHNAAWKVMCLTANSHQQINLFFLQLISLLSKTNETWNERGLNGGQLGWKPITNRQQPSIENWWVKQQLRQHQFNPFHFMKRQPTHSLHQIKRPTINSSCARFWRSNELICLAWFEWLGNGRQLNSFNNQQTNAHHSSLHWMKFNLSWVD